MNFPEIKTTTKDGVRVFDMTVSVSAYPGDKLDDWPANIQDGVYHAVETLGDQLQIPLAIVDSRADMDPDEKQENGDPVFFIHVVISEVVMALPEQVQETLQ